MMLIFGNCRKAISNGSDINGELIWESLLWSCEQHLCEEHQMREHAVISPLRVDGTTRRKSKILLPKKLCKISSLIS